VSTVGKRRTSTAGKRGTGGEDRLTDWLRSRYGLPLLGDDAAMLRLRRPFAVTTDGQIEGVHFPAGLDPAVASRRLLAVNLSDLAAMGAEPRYAFLALAVPPGFDHRRFLGAFVTACGRHGVELAGGDLARDPHGLHAVATLLGTLPEGGRWLRRAGARPGQRLWLSGSVGESALGARLLAGGAAWSSGRVVLPPALAALGAGLRGAARRAVSRHLAPEPALALGTWLGRLQGGRGGGALDVSDGLARDLHRLCRESGCGATLEAKALPQAPRFEALCEELRFDPLELALAGGEDYVLLFTLPARLAPPAEFGCIAIGRIEKGNDVKIERDGAILPLADLGWDHLEG
jgi:thiamine-monophosphate kinase